MKKLYLTLITISSFIYTQAQTPEDALRYNYQQTLGTARNAAIGGAMIGLGGELSSAHINPAGIGLYKNSEFVLSPGFSFNNHTWSNYRGTNNRTTSALGNFNVGTSGIVLGGTTSGGNIKSGALSISISKIADYNKSIAYKGFNNKSSGAEHFAEEIVAGRYDIGNAFNQRYLSLGSRLANYTYLVDTFTTSRGLEVVAMPEFTNGIWQTQSYQSSGAAHELSLALAANKNEKLFIGGSFNIPFLYHDRTTTFSEKDSSGNTTNGFDNFNYTENNTTSGIGFNGKLGLIYRPAPRVRLGLTLHTPTFYSLTDETSGTMSVKIENVAGINRNLLNTQTSSTADVTGGNSTIENNVVMTSPWRIGFGGSLVFNETQNVKKQRAFIAADIEYITYKSMRFSSAEDAETVVPDNFYKPANDAIKQIYRNAFNVRVGGEVKFNTIMVRAGANYLGNPNADSDVLKQSRLNLSGGLGYRNKGMFVDLTYIHSMNKEVNFPYRLVDKSNTYADVKGRAGTIMLTFGKKL
jgi:hypothetical protein